jgi:crotonobetainyl-CoA:carnitine CoA-transferase CaiB-like acyl-CoA transferase
MRAPRLPLDGVRVVELGVGLATPFAARLLADAGADVIKVEAPEGDRTRAVAPCYVTDDGEERSALFEYLNWNKRAVVLDPSTDGARLAGLLASAQVLLVGDDVDLWRHWRLGPEQVRADYPHLVLVSLTPFGLAGPKAEWAASDLVLQAASGLLSFSGTSDRAPLKRGLRQSTYETGMTAAYIALSGVIGVRRGHGGVLVDISMAECLTSELVYTIPEYTYAGAVSTRRRPVQDPFSSGEPVDTGGGYVTMQINAMTAVGAFADFVGAPELAQERFQAKESRVGHVDELAGILRKALAGVDPREFFQRGSSMNLLTGFVQTADQLLACPQLTARGSFVSMPGTLGGKPWRMPFTTALMTRTPTAYRRPAPALGEHTEEILAAQKVVS